MTAPRATMYRYRAADGAGVLKKGTLRADSARDAESALASQGLHLISLAPARQREWRRPIRRQDLAVFFRSVGSLVAAGVQVERAMGASEFLVTGPLQEAVAETRRRVREGASVSEALVALPDVFPTVVVGMISSGERGSRLSEALDRVATHLEEEAQLRASIQSALAYPALILLVGIASICVMGLVVVPRFAEVLSGLGAELPRSTRMLMAASRALRSYGLIAVIATLAAYAAFSAWAKNPDVRLRIHALLLRTPLIGPMRMSFASARVCRALGSMLSSGMPLLSALSAVREAAGDAELARRIGAAREAVARGQPLTASLREENALAPLALQLVGVGETSGELGPLAIQAGDVAADRAQRSLRAAVGLLEPTLVISLGLMVALIAAALLQAVYSVRPT